MWPKRTLTFTVLLINLILSFNQLSLNVKLSTFDPLTFVQIDLFIKVLIKLYPKFFSECLNTSLFEWMYIHIEL